MYIGITERGDAGIDFSWEEQIRNYSVDGAVLITKKLSNEFIKRVSSLHVDGYKVMVHCTVTGYGGSRLEPNVPDYKTQLAMFKILLETFPKENCILRIDPIFPSEKGLQKIMEVCSQASRIGLFPIRTRISIFDEYNHVKKRLSDNGLHPLYGTKFQADEKQLNNTASCLANLAQQYNISFETCAEDTLAKTANEIFQNTCFVCGCISEKDLKIMNIPYELMEQNPQERKGCHCLSCKKELLSTKKRCPNGCLYCYWKD